MHKRPLIALLAAATALTAPPVCAQDSEVDILRSEIEAMRAEMQAMNARMDALQSRLAEAQADDRGKTQLAADAPVDTPPGVAPTVPVAPAARDTPVAVAWKGGPQISGEGGWSFKPRGRLNYDFGYVSAPDGVEDDGTGFTSEARRVRLGMQGEVPGGFGYKVEVDFAGDQVFLTDALIGYEVGDLEIIAGQHNPWQGLEELTSSLHTSFIERAAFTDAFFFIRRVGLSGQYSRGDVLLQGGVFTDNSAALNDDGNNSHGVDLRAVYMPRIGDTQWHVGGSFHHRDLGDSIPAVTYRQRPFEHPSDTRFISTGSISADSETGLGLEGAAVFGRLHVMGETFWQHVSRPGLADPTFFGGAVEVGYFLTPDRRGYKGGVFDRVVPTDGLEKGGIGAWQVNARYDRLDLTDAGVRGGTQDGYMLSLIWTPTAFTRLLANYARLEYTGSVLPDAQGNRDYGVDVIAMRAQIDF
ncbi:porin [uncultured Croceicoccus sp.]|uniref:porin n=1 Tax=uncultured Croceicoccus sp. TaxID=1295329 RepID=UPI002632ED91|nr:porin [uncultured Croceicoccus sp.]